MVYKSSQLLHMFFCYSQRRFCRAIREQQENREILGRPLHNNTAHRVNIAILHRPIQQRKSLHHQLQSRHRNISLSEGAQTRLRPLQGAHKIPV